MSAWEVETGVSRLKIHLQLRIEFEVTRGYMRACLQTEGESMESSPRQSHCGNQLPKPLPSPPGKRFASTGKPPASHLPLSLTQGFSFFLCRRFLMAVHMARVPPPEPPRSHRRPARLSPQASSDTQAGWASSNPPASWVPASPSPSQHAPVALPLFPLPTVWHGCFSSKASHGGCVLHSAPFPHRPPRQLDLCPVSPLLLGSQSTCSPPSHSLHISHCAFVNRHRWFPGD